MWLKYTVVCQFRKWSWTRMMQPRETLEAPSPRNKDATPLAAQSAQLSFRCFRRFLERHFLLLCRTERSDLEEEGCPTFSAFMGLMIWPSLVLTLGSVSFWKALWVFHVYPIGFWIVLSNCWWWVNGYGTACTWWAAAWMLRFSLIITFGKFLSCRGELSEALISKRRLFLALGFRPMPTHSPHPGNDRSKSFVLFASISFPFLL